MKRFTAVKEVIGPSLYFGYNKFDVNFRASSVFDTVFA